MTHDLILTACRLFCGEGQVAEVRALGKRGTASGYFDDQTKLAAAVSGIERMGEYSGIYITLNPVNPDLLARRANRLETRLGKGDASTGDNDIISRRWLAIDIDPLRPSGVSSSDEEHAAALSKAEHIAGYLSDLGWPDPVVADSGNGAHLLYRIDLPNDDQSRDLVKGVLETLHILFSDTSAEVDRAVFNASRIWKLYGTTSRKGDNVSKRPHRLSKILSLPENSGIISGEQLMALAGLLPKEQPEPTFRDKKRGEPIVLADWLSSYEIRYDHKPYAGGSLFVLDECPFSSAHSSGAYAIQFPNGAIFAGCHHTSCGSGTQRWSEFREKFEGTIEERLKRLKRRRRDDEEESVDACGSQADPAGEETKRETVRVLRQGDPLRYMLDTFALDHIGDPVVAECLVMSLASRLVINAKGLHVSVTGESGKGKSHTFDTMLQQVPQEFRLEGRMSDKALFYIKGMKPGSVIALDDVSLSDQMQEILKGVTTSFKKPFMYRTVDKDRGGKTCTIPERCVWWVAKVEGTGDDQVWNRMLTCWIDDSPEQDARVMAHTLSEACSVPVCGCGNVRELEICRDIWRSLSQVWVVVPFAGRIRFSSSLNRRNPDMLLDLVKAHAVLMQKQRELSEAGDMMVVTATVEDFRNACVLYTALNNTSGGQETKLTKRESELVDTIKRHGQGEITISEMQHLTGLSQSVIYKMIHGSTSRGTHYSGLLEKCPAIAVCDRTLVSDENGVTLAHRREKAYSWDQSVYEAWSSDGCCWLDGDSGGSGDIPPSGPDGCSGKAVSSGNIAECPALVTSTDSGSTEDNTNNNLFLCTHSGDCVCMQEGISDRLSVCDHTHDSDRPATRDQDASSDDASLKNHDSERLHDSGIIGSLPAIAGSLPLNGDPAVRGRISRREIRVEDFSGIGIEAGPCDCCGAKWVHFREKSDTGNVKICRQCYELVRRAESSRVRILPGIVNRSAMVRVSSDRGRCQVCNLKKAEWFDPETRTAVCDICYGNIPPVGGASREAASDGKNIPIFYG